MNLQACKLNQTNHKHQMAIKKKTVLNKGAGKAAEAATEDEVEETPKEKTKEKAVANEELVTLLESYDENVAAAEKSFIDMVEFIQENQVDRATVVASMMKARGIEYESAQSQYSRMKKILNNEEVLADLKAGKITMKVAREKTKSEQKNPKSAKPEAKEQKYSTTMKSFVAAAKESGFTLEEIMTSVKAELKSAGIK